MLLSENASGTSASHAAGLSPVFLAASTTSMTSRISVQTQTAILLWAEATPKIVMDRDHAIFEN